LSIFTKNRAIERINKLLDKLSWININFFIYK
jgi:hypothetical protein